MHSRRETVSGELVNCPFLSIPIAHEIKFPATLLWTLRDIQINVRQHDG